MVYNYYTFGDLSLRPESIKCLLSCLFLGCQKRFSNPPRHFLNVNLNFERFQKPELLFSFLLLVNLNITDLLTRNNGNMTDLRNPNWRLYAKKVDSTCINVKMARKRNLKFFR